MIIPCGRCGKGIKTPDASNAKYIMNPKDERTFGINEVVIINAPDKAKFSKEHTVEIMINNLKWIPKEWEIREGIRQGDPGKKKEELDNAVRMQIDTLYNQKLADFVALPTIFPDEQGRTQIISKEQVQVPKTLIVCPGCVLPEDMIIW